ncbi:MAG TPA: diguanylate cyclase [Candidatus Limnocylindrales bacterium]|nr:diguanylate cyclase [Candidatus Limnocylindrales bacterium]
MSADSGDAVGDARADGSKERDADADARDVVAEGRDRRADSLDVAAARMDEANARMDQVDRERHPEDREDSARLRELAALDRQMAQDDRIAAHGEADDATESHRVKAEERERRAHSRDVAAADRDDVRAHRDVISDALDEAFEGMAEESRARRPQAREEAHDRRAFSAGDRLQSADDRREAAAAHNEDVAALSHRAQHDPLTGLANRGQLEARISEALNRSPRLGGSIAVLFCDLDNFKSINDTHGHSGGDEILKGVAERVRGACRADDLVARLGGDEFVVVLHGVRDLAAAAQVAEKIRLAVHPPMVVAGVEVTLTISIGLALAGPDADPAELLGRADQALYRAKDAGRDRVVASTGT